MTKAAHIIHLDQLKQTLLLFPMRGNAVVYVSLYSTTNPITVVGIDTATDTVKSKLFLGGAANYIAPLKDSTTKYISGSPACSVSVVSDYVSLPLSISSFSF